MSDAIGFEGDRRNSKALNKLTKISFKTEKAIRETWFLLGRDLKNEVRREIERAPKSGRTYFIRVNGGRLKRHIASAPGETHADLSRTLKDAAGWKVHGADRLDFGYGFDGPTPEWDRIEDGFEGVEARPSLENAVNKIKDTTESHFQKAILNEFKRA